jgi:hypothetical protein
MTLTAFSVAACAGVFFWNAIAGRFEGDRLERSLRIPVGRYFLHVHHWLYCLALFAALFFADSTEPYICGFLAGSILQGLTYRDWYLVLYQKQRAESLYARWRPLGPSLPEYDG